MVKDYLKRDYDFQIPFPPPSLQDFDALTQALWEDADDMGGKDRMTYSDLNKLFKKHRSLANDLADRLDKTLALNESQDSQMTCFV